MPTKLYQPDAAASPDCYIADTTPDANYNTTELVVGVGVLKEDPKNRFLVKFDISDDPAVVIVIPGTKIEFFVIVTDDYTGDNYILYRITELAWKENATWNDAETDTPTAWAAPGGDYTALIFMQEAGPDTSGGVDWWEFTTNIVAHMQDVLDARSGVVHLLCRVSDEGEGAGNGLAVASSDTVLGAQYPPKLTLCWRERTM